MISCHASNMEAKEMPRHLDLRTSLKIRIQPHRLLKYRLLDFRERVRKAREIREGLQSH